MVVQHNLVNRDVKHTAHGPKLAHSVVQSGLAWGRGVRTCC